MELPRYVGALCILDGKLDAKGFAAAVAPRAEALLADLDAASDGAPVRAPRAMPRGAERRLQVRRTAAAPPGGHAQLIDAVAEVWSRPLPRSRFPFEVTVVEGLAGGESAVVVKARHGVFDEGGGVELLERLLRAEPALRVPGPGAPTQAVTVEQGATLRPVPRSNSALQPPASLAVRLARAVGAVATPWIARSSELTGELARGLAGLLEPGAALERAREAARWLESTSLVVSTPGPETPINGPIGATRRIGFVRLSRDVLAGIEEALAAPLDEIVLTIVAEALGRYLEGRGRTTVALDLMAIVKPLPGDPPVDAPGALIPLPVGTLPPAARHAAVCEALNDPIARTRLARLETLLALCSALPAPLRDSISTIACQAANTACVRVRPPRPGLQVEGRRVALLVPIAPLPWNVGLGFAWTQGADDEVVIGLQADTELVAGLGPVEDALRAAYVEAAAAAGVPAIDPERASA